MLHLRMSVRMTVLASGSRGNCTVFSNSTASILVDAGLSCRETLRRMKEVGEDPHKLKAILISHEHADHVAGLPVLARKLQVPVYITEATYHSWRRFTRDGEGKPAKLERREHFQAGRSFAIDGVTVTPFTISHDAADPCGFTLQSHGIKIGIVTDLGYVTANVKQRVMSRVGHLSNAALADFFEKDYDGQAAFLVLAHLSEHNNHPELAREAAYRALGGKMNLFQSCAISLAQQDKPLRPLCLG